MSLADPSSPDPSSSDPSSPRQRRQTRRGRSPRQIDTSVPSPCLAICQIRKGDAECIGCRRTMDEIRDWMMMTAEEKQAVLDRLAALPKTEAPSLGTVEAGPSAGSFTGSGA